MTVVTLEALRSDDFLGVLAALGALDLLAGDGVAVRLGWNGLGGSARLESELDTVDAVAARLQAIALHLREAEALVPADPQLIERRRSQADRKARKAQGIEERNDPMRGKPVMVRDRLLDVARLERERGDYATPRWAAGLLTMLGVDRGGDAVLTPLYAPVGQQVLAQLLEKYLELACEDGVLKEALLGWRRRPDNGANLDYRDLRDAAWTSRGEPDNASVPGATWLALMAMPWFRQVGTGLRADAVGWHREPRAVRPRTLLWPVWFEPRAPEAIEVLLSHPVVRKAGINNEVRHHRHGSPGDGELGRQLRALGVVAVCTARRAPLGNADGPLQATHVVWP